MDVEKKPFVTNLDAVINALVPFSKLCDQIETRGDSGSLVSTGLDEDAHCFDIYKYVGRSPDKLEDDLIVMEVTVNQDGKSNDTRITMKDLRTARGIVEKYKQEEEITSLSPGKEQNGTPTTPS